ncbi:coagulation factor III, tissue factor a isoform X5 [Vanacampus margaritifer]
MLTTKWEKAALALLILLFLNSNAVTGLYPRAQTVTWKSTNFKTILTWEPLPTDYSYTVEFSVVSRDKQRNSNCIRISTTMCDLTSSLADMNACYVADVLSEPPLGVTSDLTEFPYISSSRFCPANETDIGRPDFKLEKVFISKMSVIELTDLDQGESYCFNIQAFIPSRSSNKQLGELSQTQCSDDDKQSVFEDGAFSSKHEGGDRIAARQGMTLCSSSKCNEQPSSDDPWTTDAAAKLQSDQPIVYFYVQ